eukprot:4561218-Heterocapsa_arctica.AAC.1
MVLASQKALAWLQQSLNCARAAGENDCPPGTRYRCLVNSRMECQARETIVSFLREALILR